VPSRAAWWVAVVLAAAPQQQAPDGRNLLANPSFEAVDGTHPRDWSAITLPQFRKSVEFTLDENDAKDGKQSVRVKNTEPGNLAANSFTQRLEGNAAADLRGKWLRLSGHVRGKSVTVADAWIQCFDEADRELARYRCRRYGGLYGTFAWTAVAAQGEIPKKTKVLVVRCVLTGTGEAWFDNMKLCEIKAVKAADPPKLGEEEMKLRDALAKFVGGGDKPVAGSFADVEKAVAQGLGPPPWASGYKKFTFRARDHEWTYEMWIPEEARKGGAWPLLLDPGHPKGQDDHKNWVNAGARDLFVLRANVLDEIASFDDLKALEGVDRDLCLGDIYAALVRDVGWRVPVDPNRIYLTGISMTAHADWLLAALTPDRFAAAAPFSGFPRNFLQMAANLRGQGWFVVHGDADTICPVAATRTMVDVLKAEGVDHVYRELPALGHTDVIVDRGNALEWMSTRAREPYPKRVSLRLLRSGGGYWIEAVVAAKGVSFDPEKGYKPNASVDAEIQDNVVTLKAAGATSLKVWLNGKLVDYSKPVKFILNGKEVVKTLAPSMDVLLERLKSTGDAGALYDSATELIP